MSTRSRWLLVISVLPLSLHGQSLSEGRDLYKQGRIPEARKVIEATVAADPKNAEAQYWMAVVLLHRDIRDVDGAIDHIEESVDLEPNNADYQYLLGGAYGQKAQSAGMIKQAFLAPKVKKAFLRAVELNPGHVEARIGLAQYYLMAPGFMGGDDDEGWRQLDEVVRLNEKRGRAVKATMFEREKKFAEAEGEWKKLTAAYPDDWAWHKNLGYFLLRRDRPSEAVAPMLRYVTLRPDTADAFDSFGEILLAAGRAEDAIVAVRKALAIDPGLGSSWFVLGSALEKVGKKGEARSAYENVLKFDKSEQRKKKAADRLKELG